ncbi:arabinosyltransferase domain-containing protein [Corynebacterium aquilae]|uniref:Arabinosyltransferase n=1 Tax=Corynebacterium aquilae DSM 44791 TaxID=1431546 RepID=A0A1L7CDC8_9CORY|nr:arabinosyltransferase domain-containing protein [Corynebacterium aquilae]APT83803.1 arabinosyltransferase [Corynebacterium aquilae DSM 44791]
MSYEGPSVSLPKIKFVAIFSGIAGFLLFVLTPFLPVVQHQSSIDWPQENMGSISAPLISYVPENIEADIPLPPGQLNPGQTMVFGTLPPDSKDATTRGLFVRVSDGGLDVVARDKVPFELTKNQLENLPAGSVMHISSSHEATTITIDGTNFEGSVDSDERPQFTGIYTELSDVAAAKQAGLSAHVEINSRFTSSPSLIKYGAMFLGTLLTVISLWALHRMDVLDGRTTKRMLPPGWYKPRAVDLAVFGGLGYWYIFGANTSDDGYLLTMARVSHHAEYMANYYRWFGVPESPFGAPYYDLLGVMAQISTSSVFMRLPELVAAVITWLIISREVLPRLGQKIAARPLAQWTAVFSFLGFWMVYNNGLRPEPVIAMGALLTWVSIERAIATSRLLPAAIGVIIATISLGAGPTGLMAVAALLAGLSSLIRIVVRRRELVGSWSVLAMCAPFLASGTAILMAVFGDQTLATVLESIRVRSAKGPSLVWYDEWVRYETLMTQNVDGSFPRRFAVLMMFFCLAIVLATVLRNGRVPGAAVGPSNRLMMVFFGTMFFMMFTPTKWSHHFGVYAGIGAGLAALAAVSVSAIAVKSARNRTLFIGATLFVLAISLAGINGWWYISSFGVPWWDKTIQYRHVEATNVMLLIALVVLAFGAFQSFQKDVADQTGHKVKRSMRFNGVLSAPITVVLALVVVFDMLSLGKGFVAMYPAYSVGLGNVRALAGNSCNLANDAMVETNTNDSFLTPIDGISLGDSLESDEVRGFGPNNVPSFIDTTGVDTSGASAGSIAGATDDDTASGDTSGQDTGTTGGLRREAGVNGSIANLPFDLDYKKVPMLGSYTEGPQFPAEAITSWYELPARSEDAPLVIVSAAGRIEHHDINGVYQNGQKLVLEYATKNGSSITNEGQLEPLDIGPSPSWRNLRFPLDRLPEDANVVRIKAVDNSLDPEQWLAFTPPRVPTLKSLNEVVGSEQPGLLDWSVALQFPCQRPFDHYVGVAEAPQFRISPDHAGKVTLSPWQDYAGGGVMGIAEAINTSVEVPAYLKDDWGRDWGSLERYRLRTNSRGVTPEQAEITVEDITRTGWWNPGPMKISDDNKD